MNGSTVGPYQDATSADPVHRLDQRDAADRVPAAAADDEHVRVRASRSPSRRQQSLNHNDLTGSPPSNSGTVTFAATPEVSSIHVLGPDGKPAAFPAGPTTGGTKIVINGAGLEDANQVGFLDTKGPLGQTYTFSLSQQSPSQIGLLAPARQPEHRPGVRLLDLWLLHSETQKQHVHLLPRGQPAGHRG